jgi:hypothetical protein
MTWRIWTTAGGGGSPKVQHLLLELVRELDDKGRQYPFTMNEA